LNLPESGCSSVAFLQIHMKPRKPESSPHDDLFRMKLEQLINQRHELCRLARVIDWQHCEVQFGALYAEEGRPGIPVRLMVGLHYLKHAFNESAESVVARWVENPYWQYFCGEEYFSHRAPIDPSQMTRFRQRIGESGCEWMLGLSVRAGLATQVVKLSSLRVVNVDTTVQEKAIAFPTDARLYHKARAALVRQARKANIALRQSYARVGKLALAKQGRYANATHMKRARREQRKLRTYLGRVIRDIERKATAEQRSSLARLLDIAWRIHQQQRKDHGKVYSVQALEVECIAKGKAHQRYEFGVKVGIVSTSKESFVIGMQALPGNPYDGHTLAGSLEQVQRITGLLPTEAYVDRGYKGHGVDTVTVWIAGAKRGVTAAIKRKLKRRNAIEPVIGHLKSDGRLGRNFLKGELGDAMNALLCGAGHNLRKILNQLRLFCAHRHLDSMTLLDALFLPRSSHSF
jgi:transposase, IS5 family